MLAQRYLASLLMSLFVPTEQYASYNQTDLPLHGLARATTSFCAYIGYRTNISAFHVQTYILSLPSLRPSSYVKKIACCTKGSIRFL